MWEVNLLLIFGIGFLALGIRHNKKIHSEEGTGNAITGSIILDYVMDYLYGLLDKLPYWVAKSLYFIVALLCFVWSYILFNNLA